MGGWVVALPIPNLSFLGTALLLWVGFTCERASAELDISVFNNGLGI